MRALTFSRSLTVLFLTVYEGDQREEQMKRVEEEIKQDEHSLEAEKVDDSLHAEHAA